MQRGRETRSHFESQETPFRQTSSRMIFNVTRDGATEPNRSKTEAIRDRSFRNVELISSVI